MLAVDTNILVRLAVRDDAAQVERIRAAVQGQRLFISLSVLLETEWVLRSTFKLPPAELTRILAIICGLPRAVVEQAERVRHALDDLQHGLDFADALHLRSAVDCSAFLTFDRKLLRRAADAFGGTPVREP